MDISKSEAAGGLAATVRVQSAVRALDKFRGIETLPEVDHLVDEYRAARGVHGSWVMSCSPENRLWASVDSNRFSNTAFLNAEALLVEELGKYADESVFDVLNRPFLEGDTKPTGLFSERRPQKAVEQHDRAIAGFVAIAEMCGRETIEDTAFVDWLNAARGMTEKSGPLESLMTSTIKPLIEYTARNLVAYVRAVGMSIHPSNSDRSTFLV